MKVRVQTSSRTSIRTPIRTPVRTLLAAPLLALSLGVFAQAASAQTPPRAEESCQTHPEACSQAKQVAPQVKAGAEAACSDDPTKCQQEKARANEHHDTAKTRRSDRGATSPQ